MNPYTEISHRIEGTSNYRFDKYFTERWCFKHFKELDIEISFYHITFETLIKAILKTGFIIEDYVDVKPSKITARRFLREYERNMDRPFFMVFKLRKP